MRRNKLAIVVFFAFTLTTISIAHARDDGGFSSTRVNQAPAALGDNTADLIAAGDMMDPKVAYIEPAAGDDVKPAATSIDEPKLAPNSSDVRIHPAARPSGNVTDKTVTP